MGGSHDPARKQTFVATEPICIPAHSGPSLCLRCCPANKREVSLVTPSQLQCSRVMPLGITDVAGITRDRDSNLTEIVVPRAAVRFETDRVKLGQQIFVFGPDARSRVYEATGAPEFYFGRLTLDTQAAVLNAVWNDSDANEQVTAVVRGDEFFTFSRADLIRLQPHEVVSAITEALGDHSDTLSVTRIRTDGDYLELEVISSRQAVEVRRGDVVQAGLHVVHTRFGNWATVVEAFVFRCVCDNGMIHRECLSRDGISRTRKLSANHPGGRELQLEQIRRLAARACNRIEPLLGELHATTDRATDVEKLLESWLRRARISVDLMLPRLLAAWELEGAERTEYGAINALTRLATHDGRLSARQRRTFASLAGMLAFSHVHICPRCFAISVNAEGSKPC